MNEKLTEIEYYLGLDCGTSSVGFAVTDTDYNLLKFNGKSMWGSHLFDEAKTAQTRRGARCARRRLQRRKQRILLLQQLFSEEVYKTDPTFFIRLNDSHYLLEDKHSDSENIVFNDENYKDKDYFKDYPTIFHLRHALIKEKITDIRLLYLGIAHILKNRGHFLFPGDNLTALSSITPLMDDMKEAVKDVFGLDLNFSSEQELENALRMKKNSEKSENLEGIIEIEDVKLKKLIIRVLLGYKINPQQLFYNDEYEDLCAIEFRKLSFEDSDMPVLEESLSSDEFKFIVVCKAFFDWSLLENIRNGKAYISESKIELFENNQKDLKQLKQVIKKYAPDKYYDIFHGTDGFFVKYIGKNHDKNKNKEFRTAGRGKVDEFYKSIKTVLNRFAGDSVVDEVLEKIENGNFLPLLVSFRNGVIPYQLNKLELEAILNNAKKHFDFLNKKDSDGLSVSDKIISILTYRIPYYVGPLNTQNDEGKNWIVRQASGRILPWNIEKKVDFAKSAENFITRMTNKCTYFKFEDVLPKQSLAYSRYMVLNELNNIRIKGIKLSVEEKQLVFNELFKKRKKVTIKNLMDFAVKEGWYAPGEISKEDITGIDGDFKSNMSSYFDFKEYLENKILKADDVDLIIKWITVFSDGGEILRSRIKEQYGKVLTKSDISKICRLKYSGWGRFSHKFLFEIYGIHKETGELLSIMRMLWETQNNLMELMSGDYEYIEQIDKPEVIGNLEYSVVDDLYVSPAVKKQIWQTLRIVDEIEHIMKHAPKKVFVEVTRSEAEKKRTKSRKDDLIEKLTDAKKSDSGFDVDFQKLLDSLTDKETSQIARQDKLYLYYSQCGKCMYSSKPIVLDDLYNTDLYDIDHIFPYSKSNDDSLKNKVLVLKTENTRKSNDYPIDDSVRNKMQPFWKMLLDKHFIPKEKYERLTRSTPLSEEDTKGFIARQLVETSQNVKETASILKSYFGDNTKIVYSKAGLVSDFRDKFKERKGFVKCRSLNHLHHAKDAYLNIVVGNVHDTKYSGDFFRYVNGIGEGNLSEIYRYQVKGAWIPGEKGTLKTVSGILCRNDVLFTRQPVEKKGQLFDLQIVPKGSKKGAMPVKTSDTVLLKKIKEVTDITEVYGEWTSKYGGYNSLTTAYFSVIKNTEKNKTYVSFIPISVIDSKKLTDEDKLKTYCENVLKLKNVDVVRKKLLLNTELEINGYKFTISGKSNGGSIITVNSSIPLILSDRSQKILKKVESFIKKKSMFKGLVFDSEKDSLSDEDFGFLYQEIMSKGKESIYTKRPGSQQEVIEAGKDKFMLLSGDEKCAVIIELMNYYGMGSGLANFVLIGGTKACGTITKGARIDKNKSKIEIIDKSVTGLFENKVQIV